MEELNKKIIGNAVSAYLMVLVSVTFLFSTKKYLNHPFVKSHVKSAFLLHVMLLLVWFVMSFGFFSNIALLGYSLNTIITAILLLCIFGAILYGMHKANKGETVTVGEIFHKASSGKQLLSKNKGENIQESDAIIMILSHVPFLGYIVGTRNKDLPHMRDILQLNFIATLSATLFLIFGYDTFANITMIIYLMWSVSQSIFLIIQGSVATIGLDIIPTVEEKYILQKTTIRYVLNTLNKKIFTPFKEIQAQETLERKNDQIKEEKNLNSPYSFVLKNSAVLLILFCICVYFFDLQSPILILFLFPISYLFGYSEQTVYKMPYIYDIYHLVSTLLYKTTHMFSVAKKLKNTTLQESVKMGEENIHSKK